jgi:hypothetical protein
LFAAAALDAGPLGHEQLLQMVLPHAGVVVFAVIPFIGTIALFASGIFMYK